MQSCDTHPKHTTHKSGACFHRKRTFHNLEEIVQDYIDWRRPCAKKELRYFKDLPNLPTAICVAALAIGIDEGKRHPHQRRIPEKKLERFRQRLARKRRLLRPSKTFSQLMQISEKAATGIWKNSELTVYDTTHRIGAYLRVRPDRVYLHAGTREGAKALDFKRNLPFILPSQLPKAFRRLKPYEIEDCLCIYKDDLELLRCRCVAQP